ncbi:MAG: ATP-binding protein [Candidatus Thorarchaeota archaeon]|jgi:hypothetical protein
MKIVLKDDWDAQVKPPMDRKEPIGWFAGREREVALLANEMSRRKSGSILVSGYRGVGKTSLTYKALADVDKKENVIIVLLNAAQLEAESEGQGQIDPRRIIENLIRRLYSTGRDLGSRGKKALDPKVKKRIEALYRKAVAAKFEQKEALSAREESSRETVEEVAQQIVRQDRSEALINTFFWTIAISVLFSQLLPWDWANYLISLILAIPVPYSINLTRRKSVTTRRSRRSERRTDEVYEFDSSIGNLEFDLEQIHRDISQMGRKIIYVIDELDKLDSDSVREVLKFFKNLFTISEALFIFVGGEEMYDLGESQELDELGYLHDIHRPKEYTYFTSKYFLARPLWSDLNRYLDNIVEAMESSNMNEYSVLKRALCFEAKNDFFDLRSCIRDRISDFDGSSHPIIEVDITNDDVKKARLHRVITAIFEERYMALEHTKWRENEELQRKLFVHAYNIQNSYSGTQFVDPMEDSTENSMVRDFNSYMSRIGALNRASEQVLTIGGLQVNVGTYTYTGGVPTEPPDQLELPTEIEERFMARFEEYMGHIYTIVNAYRTASKQVEISWDEFLESPAEFSQQIGAWGFNAHDQFSNHNPVYQNVKLRKPPYPYKREEIEQKTAEIESHTESMFTTLPTVLSQMLLSAFSSLGLQLQKIEENDSLFSGAANPIREVLKTNNPPILFREDFSRQIMFMYDKLEDIEQVRAQIADNAQNHIVVSVVSKAKQFEEDGLFYVVTDSRESFAESMAVLLKGLGAFFEEPNQNVED